MVGVVIFELSIWIHVQRGISTNNVKIKVRHHHVFVVGSRGSAVAQYGVESAVFFKLSN